MVLIINGYRRGVEWRNLICFPDDYEAAFDLLSQFVATGLTLVEASVDDGGALLKLPVNSFDGQLISPHLKNLQKEWETILTEQSKETENKVTSSFKEWDRQLIHYYELQIARVCKNMVCNQNAMLKETEKIRYKRRLTQISHFERMQEKYLLLLNQLQHSLKKAIVHLEQSNA